MSTAARRPAWRAARSGSDVAADEEARKGHATSKGCAESRRTNQILGGAAAGIGAMILLGGLAWWQGWIEVSSEPRVEEGAPLRSEPDGAPSPALSEAASAAAAVLRGGSPVTAPVKPAPPTQTRERIIVLSTGGGLFNTGVWPSWGSEHPDRATLLWAAAGVHVDKPCEFKCRFTHASQSERTADAVILETVNHPKFGHEMKPFPWPTQRSDAATGSRSPLIGVFYAEPRNEYPQFTTASQTIRDHADFTVTPDDDATVPIALMCPWGLPSVSQHAESVYGKLAAPYLAQGPMPKDPQRRIAFFNDRGVSGAYREQVLAFLRLADGQVDVYGSHLAGPPRPPPDGYSTMMEDLPTRLALLSTYHFVVVAQSSDDKDWIEPELSHAFAAGAVPIYWGTPTVRNWMPSDDAAVIASEIGSAEDVWVEVQRLLDDGAKYQQRLQWRWEALAAAERGSVDERFASFARRVDRCVHYAECRICKHVVENTRD